MKTKVGTLTFHRADNYGAVLQTYALQTKLNAMGCDAKVIDYRDAHLEQGYKLFSVSRKTLIKDLLRGAIRVRNHAWKKRGEFQEFRNKYFLYTRTCQNNEDLAALNLDIVLVGSDQVWNPGLTNQNESYFLGFANNNCITASYAASFGKTEFDAQTRDFIRNQVRNVQYKSVRESSGRAMLDEMGISNVEVVLDPTLLLNREEWKPLVNDGMTKAVQKNTAVPYIFMYRMTYNPNLVKFAYKLAKEKNLKIISLAAYDKPEKLPGALKLNGISPREFLSYIQNAAYVLTDSFHGLAFSVIFEKEFYTIPHSTYGSRTVDMLQKFDLTDRMVTDLNMPILSVDYQEANKIKQQEQTNSEKFLKEVLHAHTAR